MSYTTDLTALKSIYIPEDCITILEASFGLTEEDILNVLRHEYLFVHGLKYQTPRRQLLNLLETPKFNGVVRLRLTQIKDEEEQD